MCRRQASSFNLFDLCPLQSNIVHTIDCETDMVHTVLVKKVAVSVQDVYHALRHTPREQGHQIIAQKSTVGTTFSVFFFPQDLLFLCSLLTSARP